jgi:hypothetical protein
MTELPETGGFSMKKALIVLSVLMILVLTGCKSSVEEAEANFCNDLASFEAAVEALQNVHANTTVDEAERARDNAIKAYDDVVKSAAELREVKLDATQGALDGLKNQVQNISGDASLAEAAKMIRDAAKDTRDEIMDLHGANCP